MSRFGVHKYLDWKLQRVTSFIRPKQTVKIRLCCKQYGNVYNRWYLVSLDGRSYECCAGLKVHGYSRIGGKISLVSKGVVKMQNTNTCIIRRGQAGKLRIDKNPFGLIYQYHTQIFVITLSRKYTNRTDIRWEVTDPHTWNCVIKIFGFPIHTESINLNSMNPNAMVDLATSRISMIIQAYHHML